MKHILWEYSANFIFFFIRTLGLKPPPPGSYEINARIWENPDYREIRKDLAAGILNQVTAGIPDPDS